MRFQRDDGNPVFLRRLLCDALRIVADDARHARRDDEDCLRMRVHDNVVETAAQQLLAAEHRLVLGDPAHKERHSPALLRSTARHAAVMRPGL